MPLQYERDFGPGCSEPRGDFALTRPFRLNLLYRKLSGKSFPAKDDAYVQNHRNRPAGVRAR